MSETRATCIGCRYRVPIETVDTFCSYILVNGHSRGCPADKCDKYDPRTEDDCDSYLRISFAYQDGRKLGDRDDALKELYEDGLTDWQISDRLGLSESAVRRWRTRKHLPRNGGEY